MTQPIKKRTFLSFNPRKILEKIPPSLREPVDNEALVLARLGAQLLPEELDNKRVVYNNILLFSSTVQSQNKVHNFFLIYVNSNSRDDIRDIFCQF